MKKLYLFVAATFMCATMFAELQVATFEDVTIGAEESVLHLDESGKFESGDFLFQQEVSVSDWGTYYYGNLPTNKSDNEFASYLDAEKSANGGAFAGKNFVVWTQSYMGLDSVSLKEAAVVPGFFINNTAYAVNSMNYGDSFAKKFGKDDWFRLTITASLNGVAVNTQIVVDLAADGTYINEWTYVDLSEFGVIDALQFSLSSSDNGDYGMNTPAYFAMDNFGATKPLGYEEPARAEFDIVEVATFEEIELEAESVLHLNETGSFESGDFIFQQDVSVSDWGTYYYGNLLSNKSDNEFASYLDAEKSAKGGAYEGSNFLVWTPSYMAIDSILLKKDRTVPGFFINNTAYAVNSMTKGDDFAKKFGKDDWFRLTISASFNGVAVNTQVVVDLAAEGKYINEWTYVDLSEFGVIDALQFSLSSSDNGDYGMNTPAYFCIDDFGGVMPEGYEEPVRAEFDEETAVENVAAAVKAQKVVRDGQVLIIRDGKAVNMLGVEVR